MTTKLELSITGSNTSRPSYKFKETVTDDVRRDSVPEKDKEYWTSMTFESPKSPYEIIGHYLKVNYLASRAERWIFHDAHVAQMPSDYIANIGHFRYVIIFKRAERAAPEIRDALS